MNLFELFYNRFILIKINVPKSLRKKYEFHLWLNKLKTTPENIFSSSFSFLFFSIIFSFLLMILQYDLGFSLLISSLIIFFYLIYYPIFYTDIIRIEVTSESIWITLFLVLYLKRVPNLEKAIQFVAYYLNGVLADDFKEIIYGLSTKKFIDIDQAISEYSRRWYLLNPDFVYVMVNIKSIRYINSEERINKILDRTLKWVIARAREKSEDYVIALKQPAMTILMFLIMMPLVSLIMLPIISLFLVHTVSFSLIAFSYIIILPVITVLMVQSLLAKRPFAFTTPDLSLVKDLPREGYFKIGKTQIPAIVVSFLLSSISLIGIIHLINLGISIVHATPYQYLQISQQERELGNMFKVLTFPVGIGLAIGSYFYLKSFQKVKRAMEIEEMEREFPIITYEFANILDEGYPMETVFVKTYYNYRILKVSGVMENFLIISINNLKKGYNVFDSVFDKKVGSINYYPSKLIRETLHLILSSVNKGPLVLAQITYNISDHLENIVKVRDLIRKTLSEITSLLENAASFMVPFMSSIVTVFNFGIITILYALVYFFSILDQAFGLTGSASLANFIINTFNLYDVIPPTVFVAIIGVFFIEFTIIASFFATGIKYGFDKTMINYYIGKNLLIGTIFYFIISLAGLTIVSIMFGSYLPTAVNLVT